MLKPEPAGGAGGALAVLVTPLELDEIPPVEQKAKPVALSNHSFPLLYAASGTVTGNFPTATAVLAPVFAVAPANLGKAVICSTAR